MTSRLGMGVTEKRAISEIGYETTIALQIVQEVAQKMRKASLSAFTQQGQSYTTPVEVPLSPKRFREYINECTQELSPFSQIKHRTESAADLVKSSFTYPKFIDPQDLSCTEVDCQMEQWLKETIETTSHEMELKRKTLFEPIPSNQQANCCFRYALERVGLLNLKPIENPSILRSILLHSFFLVKDPQEGDLILFSSGGQLTHLGIRYQGKVLSKEGNLAKVAYIRPIEDLVSIYGEKFQYLRKKSE